MAAQPVLAEQRARVATYVEALPAIGAIQEHAQHAFVAACLAALARLRVADHIDGTTPVELIATRAGCDLQALLRILRFVEPYGVFEFEAGCPRLTAKGLMLRSDSPIACGLMLRGANDAAWNLSHSLRTGKSAFAEAFGCDFWSFLDRHDDQQAAFAEAMRLQSALLAVACLPLIDFSGLATVADVGGGTGDLLAAILETNAQLNGILVEREAMLSRAHPALRIGSLAARCRLQPGDLFGALPVADAYILSQVLHNWADDKAAQILSNIRRAAKLGARLILFTGILSAEPGPHPTKTGDIGMMALFGGGRERTESEFRQLLSAAGWKVESIADSRVASAISAIASVNDKLATSALPS